MVSPRYTFMNYILVTFLASQIYWQHIFLWFVYLRKFVSLSLLWNKFAGYRILGWWFCLNIVSISLYSIAAWVYPSSSGACNHMYSAQYQLWPQHSWLWPVHSWLWPLLLVQLSPRQTCLQPPHGHLQLTLTVKHVHTAGSGHGHLTQSLTTRARGTAEAPTSLTATGDPPWLSPPRTMQLSMSWTPPWYSGHMSPHLCSTPPDLLCPHLHVRMVS